MLDFQKLDLSEKERYNRYLMHCGERGCEYSLVNLYLWGRQRIAFVGDCLAFFSQFERSSVYPFPIGNGDIKTVLDAVIHDARMRGLECRLTTMDAEDCALLEKYFPGRFRFHSDRDSWDYIYDIHALADLPGRKYQRKRNHLNRFRQDHPDCRMAEMDENMLPRVEEMVAHWFESHRTPENKDESHMEQKALRRFFSHFRELGLEGAVLVEDGKILAMAVGSFLSDNTFNIHFEKALDEVDGAYTAINQAFAAHLQRKYPQLQWLNREDDLGLPGLRKSKLSYHPHHMVEKFWANLLEDEDEH
ncbi:MAG: DUF2156 domain-containing protein [Ruminococcaceae bacterium]|nr:DUF2156 domain-containing protein [Oscillospiraceae bacterium]